MNWGTLGANLTTMSDDMPLHLPRYVFRRANGSFRYKRNVPERLRPLIGKATLYRQLGDSYREAMQALPLVHARIEALLNDEADKSARERSLEIIRGALGDEVAEMVLAETVPEYSPIEDALNELGKDLHKQKMPTVNRRAIRDLIRGVKRGHCVWCFAALWRVCLSYSERVPKRMLAARPALF